MIVDTSVVVAILNGEPEAESFARALDAADTARMSAGSYLECSAVIDGNRNALLSRRLDDLLKLARIMIAPFTEEQARIARQAYRDFGRGSGHPARLNFGDCFAYALAKDVGAPLLFKGSDFSRTDVEVWTVDD